ncbi:MAG: nuclease-related domain-containing protein [Candidatus Colwellbacteria bacterium]|nr:nuclease-related domain-containing protein [Candidatus Colwellbacteria bacterium]
MTLKKNLGKIKNRASQSSVNRIRGELNENYVSKMLAELAREKRIISFRPATKIEQEDRCDFIVVHPKGVFAVQVKSSDFGAAEFRDNEKNKPRKRRMMKVMVFVTSIAREEKKEIRRLGRSLDAFVDKMHDITPKI